MRIPSGARVYLTTAISLVAVGLATWLGMQAGAAVVDRQWWTLGAVAASVTAAELLTNRSCSTVVEVGNSGPVVMALVLT